MGEEYFMTGESGSYISFSVPHQHLTLLLLMATSIIQQIFHFIGFDDTNFGNDSPPMAANVD